MIEPIGPDVIFRGTTTQVILGRVNARLGEVWASAERAEGREVTFRQIGITSPDSANTLAERYRSRGWEVVVDADHELLRFRVARS